MSNLRTIKIRGDYTENWELANPILEYKEIACEFTDNGTFFKVGNGTDSWNDLAYASTDDGIGEAPADGKLYARKDSAWAEVVVQGNAVTSVSGKTGAVILTKADVGLSNVDNTSDVDKPISNPTQDALDNKVDKVTGKGLSTNDYSNADKAKLASLEGSHFRGVYVNEAALATIPNPVAGDYADVDAGIEADAERWIYDASDSKWVSQESAASVTAAQVKQLYESNTNTNAFTNVEKTKLSGIATEATKNRADTLNADKEHTHTTAQVTGLDSALSSKVDKETGKSLIEPAPVDGKQYARKDDAWAEIATPAPSLGDLSDVDFGTPTEGQVLTYDAATQKSKFADASGGDVEEAPLDGKGHVRKDGAWALEQSERTYISGGAWNNPLSLQQFYNLFIDFRDKYVFEGYIGEGSNIPRKVLLLEKVRDTGVAGSSVSYAITGGEHPDAADSGRITGKLAVSKSPSNENAQGFLQLQLDTTYTPAYLAAQQGVHKLALVAGSGYADPATPTSSYQYVVIDSNGFIKESSPIINLTAEGIVTNKEDGLQNAEFTKQAVGVYELTGVPLLARTGWYIETPKDRNNNVYFTLDYEEFPEENKLVIRTYEPDYSSGKAENGSPVDILTGRFVALRFEEDAEV